MKFPRNVQIFRGQLDVAAYASVLFLLVLFFALSSSFIHVSGIRIDLPTAPGVAGFAGPSVSVAVSASGQLHFENQPVTFEQLRAKLQARVNAPGLQSGEPLTLVLYADRAVTVEVEDRLRSLATEIGIPAVVRANRPGIFSGPEAQQPAAAAP